MPDTAVEADMQMLVVVSATLAGSFVAAWMIQRALLEACVKAITSNRG
ncbi:MAG TPA: hypothetical protein VG297_14490 [Bryobacteraceae bacterium]|nr:hypothetical protein [Bryobacteraceae bacterium]